LIFEQKTNRVSRIMKKSIVTFLITLSLLFSSKKETIAQVDESVSKVGSTVAQFLKIGAGARAIGMGGAYTALADDINAIYWNPAGIAKIGGSGEATFNHAEWLADTQYDFAAFSFNSGGLGTLGLHIISFRTPEEPVRTVRSPGGTGQVWDYNAIAIGGTWARNLTDRFAIGFTGKYIQENIFNEVARGAALDIGVLYQTPFKNLSLGAAITNFGTTMKLEGRDIFFNEDPLADIGSVDQVPSKYTMENFNIPLFLRFGLAWKVTENENYKIIAIADGAHPNDNTEYINSGVEIGLRDIVFLRAGYKGLFMQNTEEGLTFGAGLHYNTVGLNIKFDFGYADFNRLKNVQFVSIGIRY
jgi:hypothetical protein